MTCKNSNWFANTLLLIFISSVSLTPNSSALLAATPTQQNGVSSADLIKTLSGKLAAAQSDTERDALLSQNSHLLTPELNQLFVERGRESFRQGNLLGAVGNFEIAKSIAAKIDDKLRLAQASTTLGNLYRLLGQDDTALARLHLAATLHDALGNKQGSFFTLLNIVMIEISQNKYDETNLQRLQAMAAESKKDDWIATSLSQLGTMQFLKGNYALSMETHRRSLTLYERTGATEGVAFALHAIGILERVYGNYESALEYFEKSQALNEVLKRQDLYSRTLSSIGGVYELIGNSARALEYHQKSLSAGQVSGSKFWTIFSLNSMGQIYRAQGNFPEALVHLEKALKLSEELGYKDRIAYVCLSISEIKYLQRDYSKVVELAERALAIARQTGSRDLQWKALTTAGKAYYALDQHQKVEPLLEEATNTLESLRSTVIGEGLRSSYFATVQQPYELYIDVLMQQKLGRNKNAAALALQINERRLARSLLETLSEAHTDIRKGVDDQLLERERSLQRQLNAIASQRMRMSMTDEKALTLNKEINALTADYQRIESEIRQSSPSYAALTQPRSLTVKQIQNDLLDADTVLLEYSLGKERSYVWLITSTSLNSFELPGRSQIETSARNLANLLNAGERWATDSQINSEFAEEAAKLSRTLLPAALVSQLRAKRLLIVSDGALQYLPFGVLPIAKTPTSLPLIAHYEIVTLPSASTLAVLRQENLNRPPAAKSVAVIADPVFEDTDERIKKNKTAMVDVVRGETQGQTPETLKNKQLILKRALVFEAEMKTNGMTSGSLRIKRLPFTRLEAEGILAAAPPSLTLKATDFRANRETATSVELASFRYLHFATHGILNAEHPELSGIVLSLVDEQGKPVDGFLRLHDIYNLNLPADLVVLSACQTGLGKEIRGEGLVGLTRGFMYAGASRVVASLWKVDDAATAELMKRFYSAMLKYNLRPAAALRRAKVEMWKQKRWQAPFYWAAFELQGEWK